ncbi:3 beta-hydroxysteroid dehydrogenase/Delta 5--_4-isomerase type 1 [Lucilia cuprina]|nr:3 beta-hydroxysteroid dehydrogenase/Delta 5-->4-isomerase type 1 [Lucilia cuprina]
MNKYFFNGFTNVGLTENSWKIYEFRQVLVYNATGKYPLTDFIVYKENKTLIMVSEKGEIVLVTGGSGFIGQHIIKQLLRDQNELNIKEIRTVDLVPYKNKISSDQKQNIRIFVGDICQPDEVADAFKGVDTVFHCAALVCLQYPPNYKELERVNVDGTRAVVELCVEHNIKPPTPKYDAQNPSDFDKNFLIPGYSASKLRAETIVLNSNGAMLKNQNEYLTTAAIRPPLTYGEAGAGGKQQISYAGNVAWGHICAYKTLKSNPKAIAGLPIFVTDDTPINDISRFIQKIALLGGNYKVRHTSWYLPHFLFFFIALLTELLIKVLAPFKNMSMKFSLRAISSFTASVMMFNRLRAAIHMDYVPLIDVETSLQKSANWYSKWWEDNISKESIKSKVN